MGASCCGASMLNCHCSVPPTSRTEWQFDMPGPLPDTMLLSTYGLRVSEIMRLHLEAAA